MVFKNYEILTGDSRHLMEDFHQISALNKKVWPIWHVQNSYRTCRVCTSRFLENSIRRPKLDQINSDRLETLQGYSWECWEDIFKASAPKTQQISSNLKIHQEGWGFLKIPQKSEFSCSSCMCPNHLVGMILRCPCMFWSNPKAPQNSDSRRSPKIKRRGIPREEEHQNQIKTRLSHISKLRGQEEDKDSIPT